MTTGEHVTTTEESLAAICARLGIEMPPTEDELPYSDGMPMDSERQFLQMHLLIEPLKIAWADRDFYVGGNMMLHYSLERVRNKDFLGPDVFVVLDVPRRERKSWVVWQEGKAPDVVIELLSPSTSARDKGEKKRIYQDQVRVLEYVWYDPDTGELAGFSLRDGVYVPVEHDDPDRLPCAVLDLNLVRWHGTYQDVEAMWLRWATPDGRILPTAAEIAEQERTRAEQEQARAEQERTRAEQASARAAELEALLARYRDRFGDLPDRQ